MGNTSCDKLFFDSFVRVGRVIKPALTYSHHCINKSAHLAYFQRSVRAKIIGSGPARPVFHYGVTCNVIGIKSRQTVGIID
jgi:hypothetical protein